jgi:hypothetical protein
VARCCETAAEEGAAMAKEVAAEVEAIRAAMAVQDRKEAQAIR